jgi:hypothetical protein
MSQHPYHQHLSLKNFTAFREAEFEFVPGVNVFVGENGTGKTHVMKAMYAMQLAESRHFEAYGAVLWGLFQIGNVAELIRQDEYDQYDKAQAIGVYNSQRWEYEVSNPYPGGMTFGNRIGKMERPVFIPAIDMMGHSRGFTEAYEEVRLDFDITCRDIVNLMRLERNGKHTNNGFGEKAEPFARSLSDVLGGSVERDNEGRFYLVTDKKRLPMPLVAEGLRKIATLIQLHNNGWLVPGTTLFWDEPEVNLNPILMGKIVSAILGLARSGVQIFLATHSYVILKELDLQTEKTDTIRFFLFSPCNDGTKISSADHFAQLAPNPIMEEYDSLYDRELTRSTGRNRRGERVG